MYYVLLAPGIDRQAVLAALKGENISSVFHYVPLHSSPAGQRYGRVSGSMAVTDHQSERLLRLPLWVGMTASQQDHVIDALTRAIG
ncbi:dTDP-4-amino-4,6-dideoxygalactose transaminase [compost metagenome]